jgi:hypothetical protein
MYNEGSEREVFRPGFVRLSVPFHASAQDADYVVEAVQIIARHGRSCRRCQLSFLRSDISFT